MREITSPSADAVATAALDRIQGRVDAAAQALLREGKNPTVALVRERMGGGSPNLVAPALQRWRATFAANLDENAGSSLEVLPPSVLEILQALWSRALSEAHRVRADAPSAADALEQLNDAIRDLQALTERLQAREVVLEERERQLSAAESALARRSAAFQRPPRPVQTRRPSVTKVKRIVQTAKTRKLGKKTKLARRGRVKSSRRRPRPLRFKSPVR